MERPERKGVRLKEHDYSQSGAYFVTICVQDRQKVLSRIVGRGLAPAAVELTELGQLIEEELKALESRYPTVKVDQYVIMPNHIHVLFLLERGAAGASPRPTLSQVVGTFKSLSTRAWNQRMGCMGKKLWQTSFYDHIIRGETDFLTKWDYIADNPARWAEDEYFT